MGKGVWCASSSDDNTLITQSNGTSTAAPLICGAAAVIMSAQPTWTAMNVRDALLNTASQFNNPDTIYGYWIVDVMAAINYGESTGVESGSGFPKDFQILIISNV